MFPLQLVSRPLRGLVIAGRFLVALGGAPRKFAAPTLGVLRRGAGLAVDQVPITRVDLGSVNAAAPVPVS